MLLPRQKNIINLVEANKVSVENEKKMQNNKKKYNIGRTNIQANGKKKNSLSDNKSVKWATYSDDINMFEEDWKKTKYITEREGLKFFLNDLIVLKRKLKMLINNKDKIQMKYENFMLLKKTLLKIDSFIWLNIKIKSVYESRYYCKSISGLKSLKHNLKNHLKIIDRCYSHIPTQLLNILFYDQKNFQKLFSAWKKFEKISNDIIQAKDVYLIPIYLDSYGKNVIIGKSSSFTKKTESKLFLSSLINYERALTAVASMFSHYEVCTNTASKENLDKIDDIVETSLEIIGGFKSNKIALSYMEFYPIYTFEDTLAQYNLEIKETLNKKYLQYNLYLYKISKFNYILTTIYKELYKGNLMHSINCDLFFKKNPNLLKCLYDLISNVIKFKDEMISLQKYARSSNNYKARELSIILVGYMNAQIYDNDIQELLGLQKVIKRIIVILNLNS